MSDSLRCMMRFEQSLRALEAAIDEDLDESGLGEAICEQERAFEEFRDSLGSAGLDAACRGLLDALMRLCGEVSARAERELRAIRAERERLAAYGRAARAHAAPRRPERSRFIALEA